MALTKVSRHEELCEQAEHLPPTATSRQCCAGKEPIQHLTSSREPFMDILGGLHERFDDQLDILIPGSVCTRHYSNFSEEGVLTKRHQSDSAIKMIVGTDRHERDANSSGNHCHCRWKIVKLHHFVNQQPRFSQKFVNLPSTK